MAIYKVCSCVEDCSAISTAASVYNSVNYLTTTYTQTAIYLAGSAHWAEVSFPAVGPTIWIHGAHYYETTWNGSSMAAYTFTSGGTNVLRLLRNGSSNTSIQVWQTGAWTEVGTYSGDWWVNNTRVMYDVEITLGPSGSVKLYRDNVLYIDYSGDTVGDTGATTIDKVRLAPLYGYSSSKSSLSEIIIADEDTRDMRLFYKAVNAAGSSSGFTGAYTDVDEVNASDADFISSNTADQISTFNLPDPPAGPLEVKAVAVCGRARRGTTGPQNLQYALRVNGANYTGTSITLDTAFQHTAQQFWHTSPDTASAWTRSEFDNIEVGVKSIT